MSILAGIQIITAMVQEQPAAAGQGTPSTPAATTVPSVENTNVAFFYVSDLIDIILSGIESNFGQELFKQIDDITIIDPANVKTQTLKEFAGKDDLQAEKDRIIKFYKQFSTFRILLGPLEIVNPTKASNSTFVNFGDVPVSVKYFTEWLTKKMLQEGEVIYTLTKFLNDFFNQLIKDFLNNSDCFHGSVKQKTRLSQTAITSYRDQIQGIEDWPGDNVTQAIRDHGEGSRLNMDKLNPGVPLLNVAGDRDTPDGGNPGFKREINYLTYFASRTQPIEKMNGDRKEDEARAIFHYGIGRDRGLVKTIDFSKTDSPGLKEVRFEAHGYDGLQQLREQYDVDIKTFANVNAFPGSYIYVDPDSFAPTSTEDLTQLGVGGYHMIIRSEHTFGPGQAESTIRAKWVAPKTIEDRKVCGTSIEEEETTLPAKCWLEKSDRAERSKE